MYPATPLKQNGRNKKAKTQKVPSHLTSSIAINILEKKNDDRKKAETDKKMRFEARETSPKKKWKHKKIWKVQAR